MFILGFLTRCIFDLSENLSNRPHAHEGPMMMMMWRRRRRRRWNLKANGAIIIFIVLWLQRHSANFWSEPEKLLLPSARSLKKFSVRKYSLYYVNTVRGGRNLESFQHINLQTSANCQTFNLHKAFLPLALNVLVNNKCPFYNLFKIALKWKKNVFFVKNFPLLCHPCPCWEAIKWNRSRKKVTAHKLPTGRRIRSVRAVSTELNNLRDFSEWNTIEPQRRRLKSENKSNRWGEIFGF